MTLFTFVPNTKQQPFLKTALKDLLFTFVILLFGLIYEHFSFGVYSFYMVYAFLIPLLLGVFPALLLSLAKRIPALVPAASWLWHAGIYTWTVGSLLQGVLAIYGTANPLTKVYGILGAILFSAAVIYATIRNGQAARREQFF